MAVSVAANTEFAYWQPRERRNVLVLSAEDDFEEQQNRLETILESMRLDERLLENRLFTLGSGN